MNQSKIIWTRKFQFGNLATQGITFSFLSERQILNYVLNFSEIETLQVTLFKNPLKNGFGNIAAKKTVHKMDGGQQGSNFNRDWTSSLFSI